MTLLAGRISAQAVATYQILLNLLAVVFMISLGLSSATAVLTSDAIGRKAPAEATRASWVGVALNSVFMLMAAVLMHVLAVPIGRAYSADEELAALISALIFWCALIMPPDGGQAVAAAALRARGDNWFPTASHLLAYALVMPAVAYWLAEVRGRGVAGLMLAVLIASWLSCLVLCWRLWMLRRNLPPADSRALAH